MCVGGEGGVDEIQYRSVQYSAATYHKSTLGKNTQFTAVQYSIAKYEKSTLRKNIQYGPVQSSAAQQSIRRAV